MVTTAHYSITKNSIFYETSDGIIIKVPAATFKRSHPASTRKRLLNVDLNHMLSMKQKSKKAGFAPLEKRQDIIIKKIRMLMK